MKTHQYRPLLFQELDLTLSELKVFRLALNRHFPQNELIESHSHPFDQFLLYLTGGGHQKIRNRTHLITPGTLVYLPSRTEHSFQRASGRRPLCLVLDFKLTRTSSTKQTSHPDPARAREGSLRNDTSIKLAQSDLSEVRKYLSALSTFSTHADALQLRVGAEVLNLMEIFLRCTRMISSTPRTLTSPIFQSVDRLLSAPDMLNVPIHVVARKTGYQKDYLNRGFKRAIGLTLGQYQSQKQFDRAKHLLQQSKSIQDVAHELGFSDQNYFARWFKKQAGTSPSKWRLSLGK
jgi:AraC family transcriptional regulator, transcriptional activator of pobA